MRHALIIGNSRYEDKKLSFIPSPEADISGLEEVLKDPAIGNFDSVETINNQELSIIRRKIARFFNGKKRGDLLLMYFSGHGVLDEAGQLYLAVKDTEYDLLGGTALRAKFITEQMDRSRSNRQVLILDSCHSGAVGRGTKSIAGNTVGTASTFQGTGSGRVILTASHATQYAWDGDMVTGRPQTSLFTSYLIRGLKTGEADIDYDGKITLDEVYDYVYMKVVSKNKKQTPGKWSYGQKGDIVVAYNPDQDKKPPPAIPSELINAIRNPYSGVRAGAVRELEKLVLSSDKTSSDIIYQLLLKLAMDDAKTVSLEATRVISKIISRRESKSPKGENIDASNAQKIVELVKWGKGTLNNLVLSPNGTIILIASSLGIYLYNFNTLTEIGYIDTQAWVRCAAFSPQGDKIAAGFEDGNIILYTLHDQAPQLFLKQHTKSIKCLIFSKDGDNLFAGYVDGTLLMVSLNNNRQTHRFEGHKKSVNALEISPSGKLLASASSDNTVLLWDLQRRSRVMAINGHTAPVWDLAFSADGKVLASCSADEKIILSSTGTGHSLKSLLGHDDTVNCVAFSHTGNTIISGGKDKKLILWNTNDGKPMLTMQGHERSLIDVSFAPDGMTIISASEDNSVILWDAYNGTRCNTLTGHTSSVYCVEFSADGSQLAAGSRDSGISLFDITGRSHVRTLSGHRGSVSGIAYSHDGKILASISRKDLIKLWDLISGQQIKTLIGHSARITTLAISRNGRMLATGSKDGTVIQWETDNYTPVRVYKDFEGDLIALSSDGTKLAFSSNDNQISVFDSVKGDHLARWEKHEPEPRCISYYRDNDCLIFGNVDGTISICNSSTGSLIRTLFQHQDLVWSLAFSNSGELMVSASSDKNIVLWNTNDWEPLHTIQGHTSRVMSIDFSPDGTAIASGSWDGTVRLWGVPENK